MNKSQATARSVQPPKASIYGPRHRDRAVLIMESMELQKSDLQIFELLQHWLVELQGSIRPTSFTIY